MNAERVRIRLLRASDIRACASIVALDLLWQRYGISLRQARELISSGVRQGNRLYVAVVRRQVVGFVWFQVDGTFAHSGYVRWIGIAPSARGKGIGTALMDFAEKQILRHGPNVFLLVSDFNRLARRFYKRRGYRQVGALSDYVLPGVTEQLYRKTIGPIRRPSAGRGEPNRSGKASGTRTQASHEVRGGRPHAARG